MQPTVPFVRPESNLGLAHPYTVELIDGEEREKVVPKRLHQRIQRYLMYLFKDLLQFGWEAMSEQNVLTGKIMPDGRREYVVPDVIVAPTSAKYVEGGLAEPPGLAVEILSPGQTIGDMFNRAQRLVNLGAPLVWVIWPERRRVWEFAEGSFEAHKAGLRAAIQQRNSPVLRAVRLMPGLLCACFSKKVYGEHLLVSSVFAQPPLVLKDLWASIEGIE